MPMTFRPGESAWFGGAFPEPPPPGAMATWDTAGVLGPAVGMVGALAAAEAIKLLVGDVGALNPGLIHLDAWHLTFQIVRVARREREGPFSCWVPRRLAFLDAGSVSPPTPLGP